MKPLSALIAAALMASSLPAMAENSTSPAAQGRPTQQTAPGGGGTSQAGTPGLRGSKAGPTETMTVGQGAAERAPGGLKAPSGADAPNAAGSTAARQQDSSGVQGLPGNKSGPAPARPAK